MSKQQLLAYPYITELKYREKIDEYKMNLMLRSIEESVLRSILRGSESKETLEDLRLGVETSYNALESHASKLFGYSNIAPGTLFSTSFDEAQGGRQDKVAGVTTLDWDGNRKYTRIPRYDSDNDGIADQVSPSVQVLVDDVPRNSENKVYNALNRSNTSFWIEEIANGDHTVEIQLPPSISKQFNYVELVPFPMFGMEILSVTYQDTLSTPQTLYSKSSKPYRFYNNTGPLVMHVKPKETNGTFVITVRTTHGAIGFSNIDIAMVDYRDEVQTVYMKVMNLPARTGTTTYTLDTFKMDFYINGATSYNKFISEVSITNGTTASADKVTIENVNHETYSMNGQTLQLTTSQNMYVKIVMREHNTTTPVIRGCKITYEV